MIVIFEKFFFYANAFIPPFFLWMGVFIISRDRPLDRNAVPFWQRPGVLAGFSCVLASIALLGIAVQFVMQDVQRFIFWTKLTWWAVPPAAVFWFYAVSEITSPLGQLSPKWRRLKNIRNVFWMSAAILIFHAGISTNLIFRYDQAVWVTRNFHSRWFLPTGPYYFLHAAFLLMTLWASFILLVLKSGELLRSEKKKKVFPFLMAGTFLAAAGLTSNALVFYFDVQSTLMLQFGSLLLFASVLLVGQGILEHNILMNNRVLRIDMARSLTALCYLMICFVLVLDVLFYFSSSDKLDPSLIPLVLYLTAGLYTPLRLEKSFLDRVIPVSLFPEWEKRYVNQIWEIKQDILSAKSSNEALAIAESKFPSVTHDALQANLELSISDEINKIFRHKSIENDELLAGSSLFNLKLVQMEFAEFEAQQQSVGNSIDSAARANFIRSFLAKRIHAMCPKKDCLPPHNPSKDWIEYIILFRKYILGETQSEVELYLESLGVVETGGNYARDLQSGRKNLAGLIYLEETQISGGF